ncbi:alginate export family protein [Formosa haliotis]|uniref:alginate export family protein n=1 Tax=Formosa haliotis TaxID=1555194 RepID=UPI0008247788|nr:alginate export family protein [Formosa haliotis]
MKKQLLILALLLSGFQSIQAQFTLDGEFRPRTEYRHGYGSIFPEDAEPGFAISTRARLNAGYKTEAYNFYLSLQDVLVWGENRQIDPVDVNNSFAIFQAWADIRLGNGFSTKLGRQILSYDDQRIMGGLDWAQQGRNHDAALIRYKKDSFMFDVGLAFNQDLDNATGNVSGFVSVGNEYTEDPNFFTYKAMQYLYLKKEWKGFSASVLAMNNTFQNFVLVDGVRTYDGYGVSSLQTIGTHLQFKSGAFGLEGNAFFQTGERVNELAVKGAFLLGLDASFKVTEGIGLGAGLEVISGNDADAGETGAFFPLYGTNHKFNGFMDYFYVGNHANSIGLVDIHLSANFAFNETSSLMVKILNFKGEQELPSGDSSLGTEVDLVYSKAFKGFALKLGYSQMFANDGMYELKGVPKDEASDIQNWAWAMLVMKPKFLNGTN